MNKIYQPQALIRLGLTLESFRLQVTPENYNKFLVLFGFQALPPEFLLSIDSTYLAAIKLEASKEQVVSKTVITEEKIVAAPKAKEEVAPAVDMSNLFDLD